MEIQLVKDKLDDASEEMGYLAERLGEYVQQEGQLFTKDDMENVSNVCLLFDACDKLVSLFEEVEHSLKYIDERLINKEA